jgi:DNA polymerase III sliding clamp (beta) subunit (PCNA family)
MLRKKLLEDLQIISPGLASKDLIPMLTHIWLTGTQAMSFNEQISISVECKTDFKGAVPGSILISLLNASRAKEAELIAGENELQVKMGHSKLKLAMLANEKFIFEMPKQSTKYLLPTQSKPFVAAIKSCLRSTSTDTSAPERIGITIIPEDDYLLIYSTNNMTISHEKVRLTNTPLFKRVILSSLFCEQLVALAEKAEKDIRIEIHDDYSLATFDSRINLFGHLIADTPNPIDFKAIVKSSIPADITKNVPIPAKLELALERALIITQSKTDESDTTISIADGIMTLFSQSKALGEVSDRIPLEGKHPNVKIKLHCKYLKKDLGEFESMYITDRCWIMMNKKSIYLIAGS